MAANQHDLAARLAKELEIAGHDDIHTLDILDCLGTAGLHLVEGGTDATIAYNLALDPNNK